AGCGTGRHPIEVARKYKDARVLAVDLSLTSLCYAKRKTPAPLAERIAYAQADILKIGSIERTFDLIDVSGVLHHLADPMAGWPACGRAVAWAWASTAGSHAGRSLPPAPSFSRKAIARPRTTSAAAGRSC